MISGFFVIAWGLGAAGAVNFTHGPAQSIVPPSNAQAKPVIVIFKPMTTDSLAFARSTQLST